MTLRPRFTIRTLALVVTLACAYAACWGPTKTRGTRDVLARVSTAQVSVNQTTGGRVISTQRLGDEIIDVSASMPLMVQVTSNELTARIESHYFWFFGFVAKLPYEREFAEHIEWAALPRLQGTGGTD